MKKQWYDNNRVKCLERSKKYYQTNEGIYYQIKNNAKNRNINFVISKEDFIRWYDKQEKLCHYCGRNLEEIKRDIKTDILHNKNRFSIDRKDNDTGYQLDNIVLCCHKCNTIKSNIFTYEQMIRVGNILKED